MVAVSRNPSPDTLIRDTNDNLSQYFLAKYGRAPTYSEFNDISEAAQWDPEWFQASIHGTAAMDSAESVPSSNVTDDISRIMDTADAGGQPSAVQRSAGQSSPAAQANVEVRNGESRPTVDGNRVTGEQTGGLGVRSGDSSVAPPVNPDVSVSSPSPQQQDSGGINPYAVAGGAAAAGAGLAVASGIRQASRQVGDAFDTAFNQAFADELPKEPTVAPRQQRSMPDMPTAGNNAEAAFLYERFGVPPRSGEYIQGVNAPQTSPQAAGQVYEGELATHTLPTSQRTMSGPGGAALSAPDTQQAQLPPSQRRLPPSQRRLPAPPDADTAPIDMQSLQAPAQIGDREAQMLLEQYGIPPQKVPQIAKAFGLPPTATPAETASIVVQALGDNPNRAQILLQQALTAGDITPQPRVPDADSAQMEQRLTRRPRLPKGEALEREKSQRRGVRPPPDPEAIRQQLQASDEARQRLFFERQPSPVERPYTPDPRMSGIVPPGSDSFPNPSVLNEIIRRLRTIR